MRLSEWKCAALYDNLHMYGYVDIITSEKHTIQQVMKDSHT